MRPKLSSTAVLCGTLAVSAPALAQSTTPLEQNIDVQMFRPAPGPNNFLTTHSARVGGHLAVSGGAFVNYANSPFRIYDAECTPPQSEENCRLTGVRARPVEHLATLNIL